MATQQVVNVGTQANDATGDLLRDAFTKINNNFAVFFAGNFPTAQMTIGPPVSGNALTAVGISGSAAIVATAFSVTDISLTASGTASFAGGVTFGSPTGGNKGAGSINAASLFVNNVAVLTSLSGAVTSFTSNTGLSTNVAATGTVTVTNTGVISLAGTANQVAVSGSTGAVTLTLPQNVIIPTPVSGIALVSQTIQVGPTAEQSNALLSARVASNGFEFGHTNSGGFASALGAEAGSGKPFLSFCAFAGTNSNTYKTLGNVGRVVQTDLLGGLISGRIATASADNQSITQDFSVSGSGNVVMAAPASGDTLTATNVAGGNALTIVGNSAGTAVLRLNTQATTGAQTATFAANNKPGSGTTSPDKWIPINLDGTLHYVPAFL